MEKEGGFAYALLVIIRILTIVLLCVFIYTAVQGAFFVKELRETAHTRMENGEFPLPMGGLVADLAGAQLQNIVQAGNPALQPALSSVMEAYSAGDFTELRRQLSVLDAKLALEGLGEAQAVNQQLMGAIDRGDEEAVQELGMQLLQLLQK